MTALSPRDARWERVGIGAAVLVFIAFTSARALKVPLFRSADEVAHLDYAYQVWHGHLPDFYKGLVIDYEKGSGVPVQWVSQHPPFFYLLLAPFVGPLIDGGHVFAAGMAARAINVVLGGLLVWCVGRASRDLLPHVRTIGPVAALVAACCSWLQGVSSAVYNDTVAALACTGLLWTVGSWPDGRASRRRRGAAISLTAVCLLSRLSTIAVVLPCLAALVLVDRPRSARGDRRWRLQRVRWSAWGDGTRTAVAAVCATLLTSGWFYARNVVLTGSVAGGHTEWAVEHLGRQTSGMTVARAFRALLGLVDIFDATGGYALTGVALLLVPAVVLGLILSKRALAPARSRWRPRPGGAPTSAAAPAALDPPGRTRVMALLTAATVLVLVMQLAYSRDGGASTARYTLPVILPLCLVVAGALLLRPRWFGWVLGAWLVVWVQSVLRWWSALPTEVDPATSWPTFTIASTVLFVVWLGLLVVDAVHLRLGVVGTASLRRLGDASRTLDSQHEGSSRRDRHPR